VAEKQWESHFLNNEEKENWIQDYVERETAGARKRVEDPEAAIRYEEEDKEAAENTGLTTREPKKMLYEMVVAIGDSLSDIASSGNWEDGEDEDDDETEEGQLSEDDKPGWVMGTITKTVQHRVQWFRQKQMKLDELTQPGWEDAADYLCERDKKYGTCELRVPTVVQLQTKDNTVASALTTFGEHMDDLDIVPGISQMPQGTSWPQSIHMRLGSGKPQSNTSISGLFPAAGPDSSTLLIAKSVEPGSFYRYILPPQQITI